jgi:competence protein ComGC
VVNASQSSELEKNLASLKRLLSEGLITEAEYQEKKKQQLDKYL